MRVLDRHEDVGQWEDVKSCVFENDTRQWEDVKSWVFETGMKTLVSGKTVSHVRLRPTPVSGKTLRCVFETDTRQWEDPNQKCMYRAALAISGNHCLYLVIFGRPLEPYYFELVIVGLR